MNDDLYHLKWLLERIDSLAKFPNRLPTHRNIWQGSYDVWSCEQDKIDAVEIPKWNMQLAEREGFIKSEVKKQGNFEVVVWSLTKLGKAFIEVTDEGISSTPCQPDHIVE